MKKIVESTKRKTSLSFRQREEAQRPTACPPTQRRGQGGIYV